MHLLMGLLFLLLDQPQQTSVMTINYLLLKYPNKSILDHYTIHLIYCGTSHRKLIYQLNKKKMKCS